MSNPTAILAAVDHIETHLNGRLAVGDVAQAVGYSLYYFCRTFSRITHHSPYDYLMRRRLSESARALVEDDKRIIDIALDHGFGSPEVYARAFKRMFGLQPRQVRRQGWLDPRLLMPRLSAEHLQQRGGGGVRPTIETRGELTVAGVAGLLAEDRAGRKHLWPVLEQELGGLQAPGQGWRYVGIRTYPRSLREAPSVYMVGVEVEPGLVEGTTLVTKTLPACSYACLELAERGGAMQLALDYAHGTWLPKSSLRLAQPWQIEEFGTGGGDSPQATGVSIPVE